MTLAFPWPASPGEWLAWASAIVTIAFGLVLLAAPAASMRLMRLRTAENHPEAVSEARGTMAGFYLGVGLSGILFVQPFIWLALGAGWAFTALGRLLSILIDRGSTPYNWGALVFEAVLAALPLAYFFGLT